jgi:hypothetical protein
VLRPGALLLELSPLTIYSDLCSVAGLPSVAALRLVAAGHHVHHAAPGELAPRVRGLCVGALRHGLHGTLQHRVLIHRPLA